MRRNTAGSARIRALLTISTTFVILAVTTVVAIMAMAGQSNAATGEVRLQVVGDGDGGASALDLSSYDTAAGSALDAANSNGLVSLEWPGATNLNVRSFGTATVTTYDDTDTVVFEASATIAGRGFTALVVIDYDEALPSADPVISLGLKGQVRLAAAGQSFNADGLITFATDRQPNLTDKAQAFYDTNDVPGGMTFSGAMDITAKLGDIASGNVMATVGGSVVGDVADFLNDGSIGSADEFTFTGEIAASDLNLPGPVEAANWGISVTYRKASNGQPQVYAVVAQGSVTLDHPALSTNGSPAVIDIEARIASNGDVTAAGSFAGSAAVNPLGFAATIEAVEVELSFVGGAGALRVSGLMSLQEVQAGFELSITDSGITGELAVGSTVTINSGLSVSGVVTVEQLRSILNARFPTAQIPSLPQPLRGIGVGPIELDFAYASNQALTVSGSVGIRVLDKQATLQVMAGTNTPLELNIDLPDMTLGDLSEALIKVGADIEIPTPIIVINAQGVSVAGKVKLPDSVAEAMKAVGAPASISGPLDLSGTVPIFDRTTALSLSVQLPVFNAPSGSEGWFVSATGSLDLALDTGSRNLDIGVSLDMTVRMPDGTAPNGSDRYQNVTFTATAELGIGTTGLTFTLRAEVNDWDTPFGIDWLDLNNITLELKVTVGVNSSIQVGARAKARVGTTVVDVSAALAVSTPGPITVCNCKIDFGVRVYVDQVSLADLVTVANKFTPEGANIPIGSLPPISLKNVEFSFSTLDAPALCLQRGFIISGALYLNDTGGTSAAAASSDCTPPDAQANSCGDGCFAAMRIEVLETGIYASAEIPLIPLGVITVTDAEAKLVITPAEQSFRIAGNIGILGLQAAAGEVRVSNSGFGFRVTMESEPDEPGASPDETWIIEAQADWGAPGKPAGFNLKVAVKSEAFADFTEGLTQAFSDVVNGLSQVASFFGFIDEEDEVVLDVIRVTCFSFELQIGGSNADGIPQNGGFAGEIHWTVRPGNYDPNTYLSGLLPDPTVARFARLTWDFDASISSNLSGLADLSALPDPEGCGEVPAGFRFGQPNLQRWAGDQSPSVTRYHEAGDNKNKAAALTSQYILPAPRVFAETGEPTTVGLAFVGTDYAQTRVCVTDADRGQIIANELIRMRPGDLWTRELQSTWTLATSEPIRTTSLTGQLLEHDATCSLNPSEDDVLDEVNLAIVVHTGKVSDLNIEAFRLREGDPLTNKMRFTGFLPPNLVATPTVFEGRQLVALYTLEGLSSCPALRDAINASIERTGYIDLNRVNPRGYFEVVVGIDSVLADNCPDGDPGQVRVRVAEPTVSNNGLLTYVDEGGATVDLHISNKPPVIEGGSTTNPRDVFPDENGRVSWAINFSDAGAGDGPWQVVFSSPDAEDTIVVVNGDGNTRLSAQADHTFARPDILSISTLSVRVIDKDGGIDERSYVLRLRPYNDTVTQPLPVLNSEEGYTAAGTTWGASTESGEVPGRCMVHYSWTAPSSGSWVVNGTADSFSGSILQMEAWVYNSSGTRLTGPGGLDGSVFNASQGQTYRISIVTSLGGEEPGCDDQDGITGPFEFSVFPKPNNPDNDNIRNAESLGLYSDQPGTNVDASAESGEQAQSTSPKTVWYRFSVEAGTASDSPMKLKVTPTGGGQLDSVVTLYRGPVWNEDFPPSVELLDFVASSSSAPAGSPAGSSELAIDLSAEIEQPIVDIYNDNNQRIFTWTTYFYVAVDGVDAEEGAFTITRQRAPQYNSPDYAADVVFDSDGAFAVAGSTYDFSENRNGMWVAYTPVVDRSIAGKLVAPFAADLDAYDYPVGNITPEVNLWVADPTDESTFGLKGYRLVESRTGGANNTFDFDFDFDLEAGTTYYLEVSANRIFHAQLALRLQAPANDDISDAAPIGAGGTLDASTTGATSEPGEPRHGGNANPGDSVWYRWEASPGSYQISATVQTSPSVLALYRQSASGVLTPVSDVSVDAGENPSLDVTIGVGGTYLVALATPADVGGAQATLRMTRSCASPQRISDAAGLNHAINCYNATTTGVYTVILNADIDLTGATSEASPDGSGTLLIDGQGHTIDAAGQYRGLTFRDATAIVRDLHIVHGRDTSNECLTVSCGGGIAQFGGSLELQGVTVDNSEAYRGGGVSNFDGELTITDSTISNNAAVIGAGIFSSSSLGTTVANSTVSGNTATSNGGGLFNRLDGDMTVAFSTVTNNTATGGAGIASHGAGGTVTRVLSSIVAGNTGTGDVDLVLATGTNTFTTQGYNVIGTGNASAAFSGPGDVRNVNPQLGPLANNGGDTLTHEPLPTSPAIDRNPVSTSDGYDQRGNVRVLGSAMDSGSVEIEPQVDQPGHSIAANSNGKMVLAAVKADGALYTREFNPGSGWSGWVEHGLRTWSSVDVAIDEAGTVRMVGVKQDGRLYTRSSAGGRWFGWTLHGAPTWETGQSPAIAAINGRVAIAAVKADGRLYTRIWDRTWGGWVAHGAPTWASVDVAMHADGTVRMLGMKQDGRLYTRTVGANGVLGGFTLHGAPTWTPDRAPSITTAGNQVIIAAVKQDGRLYSRTWNGQWGTFHLFGLATWSSVDIVGASNGEIWLIGVKEDGRVYTRRYRNNDWEPYRLQGAPTWATGPNPSIAMVDGVPVMLAVKADGRLYTRVFVAQDEWAGWVQHGRPTWVR